MSRKYDKLKSLLLELFQLDQPDLDFGLYRVMRARSAEVTQFLDHDLLPQVRAAFAHYQSADRVELEQELAKVVASVEAAGLAPEDSPKVQELRERLKSQTIDVAQLEGEVYEHLYSFFRRYYSDGDFLAKRVYKAGVYAIPYEGEEVTLHWANKDQYYIKTSEYLRDYAFRLRPENEAEPMRVHFRLVDATEGEHGNVKAAEGKDRVFVLAASKPDAAGEADPAFLGEEAGESGPELVIRFEYRPATSADWPDEQRSGKSKPPAQKDLTSIAASRVLAALKAQPGLTRWTLEVGRTHVKADGERADYTRLEAHLRRYTARNTSDYFIHKDLGGFLRRELDFYLKNEVMHLDDVENETVPRVEQYLSKIKVIRKIAGKLIDFLAQLEEFQKKLWLKKKFVVETQFFITLDRIPKGFYPQIAANDTQRREWVDLFSIDEITADLTTSPYSVPLTVQFLECQPCLTVNTSLFDTTFTHTLIESISVSEDDRAFSHDALCVMGDNYQGLSLIERTFSAAVTSIYIDPPYNTDAGPIAYKNGYRHSSWLALINDRLEKSVSLLDDSGMMCVTIDDVEIHNLRGLFDSSLPEFEVMGVVPIKNNPAGRTGTIGFSTCHEYAVFFGRPGIARVGRLEHSDLQKSRYKETDDIGAFEWTNFRKHGGLNTYRTARPRQFYPIYVEGKNIRIPRMEWDERSRDWNVLDGPTLYEETLLPVDEHGRERIWDFVAETARANIDHFKVRKDSIGRTAVYRKWRLNDEGMLPNTWWDKSEYSAVEYGTNLLTNLFGETHKFTFPKSLNAVSDCLRVCGLRSNTDGLVLDFFAGSGTTGHAVISLNRLDHGSRRYVLVEMGDYFDSVQIPRLRKVIYSADWKDGRPKSRNDGTSHLLKALRLESYEDTLNNLEVRRNPRQQQLLEAPESAEPGGLREQYLLRYLLDVETRGSQSLLNVRAFSDPTAYQLQVKRPGSDESRLVNVDLLETLNWLLGLRVHAIAAPQTFDASFERDPEGRLTLAGRLRQAAEGPWWFRRVEGNDPEGRKALIVWRKLTGDPERDNLVLDVWMKEKLKINTRDFEFDLIYVNGGNNLENLKTPDDRWKVRLIEEEFHRLMFDTEGS